MHFDLTPYLAKQKALDEDIHLRHGVDYASTKQRRFLALYVEVGELANETRCFKYWSDRGPGSKERILDEYADGMHFLLSLGVAIDIAEAAYEGPALLPYENPTRGFHEVYRSIGELYEHYDKEHWTYAMEAYVRLLFTLGYNMDEAITAYLSKLAVNYIRQENHY